MVGPVLLPAVSKSGVEMGAKAPTSEGAAPALTIRPRPKQVGCRCTGSGPRENDGGMLASVLAHGTPVRADGTLSKDYESHSDHGKALQEVFRASTDPRDNPSIIVGNPKRCRERIAEMKAAGIPNLIVWFNNGGGIPQAEVLKSMELFAKEVMPEFA